MMKTLVLLHLSLMSCLVFAQEIEVPPNPSSPSRYEKLKKEGLHEIMPAVDLKVDPSYQDQINQQSSALAKPPKLQDATVSIQFAPQATDPETVESMGDEYQVPEDEFNQ